MAFAVIGLVVGKVMAGSGLDQNRVVMILVGLLMFQGFFYSVGVRFLLKHYLRCQNQKSTMLNSSLLDKGVLEHLKVSGWTSSREFDASVWIKQLTKEGYMSFQYATAVLKAYGGLRLKQSRGTFPADIDFNAFNSGSGEADRLEIFEPIAGEHLFPIGMIHQLFLYVGPSKRIYMGDYDRLYVLGNSIEDFLNNINQGKKPELVGK